MNSKEDVGSNSNPNPHHDHGDNPIQRQESVMRGEETKKVKKGKKKKSRHRERDRKIGGWGDWGGNEMR